MSLVVRPARLTDVDACVPLIYSAGPEVCDYLYRQGRYQAHDFIRYGFCQPTGFLSHRLHTVAEYNGTVVGIYALYSRKQLTSLNLVTFMQLLRCYPPQHWLPILVAAHYSSALSQSPNAQGQQLANFAVSPDCRSQGIGRALLYHAADTLRAHGYDQLSLDVSEDNTAAIALYTRMGFEPVKLSCFRGTSSPSISNSWHMCWHLHLPVTQGAQRLRH